MATRYSTRLTPSSVEIRLLIRMAITSRHCAGLRDFGVEDGCDGMTAVYSPHILLSSREVPLYGVLVSQRDGSL